MSSPSNATVLQPGSRCGINYNKHVLKCVDNVLVVSIGTVELWSATYSFFQVFEQLVYERSNKAIFKRVAHKMLGAIVSEYNDYVAVLLTIDGQYHL